MNEFVSWCRHLLVSFLFHALVSLHPPSFHRNDFSTCSTHFLFAKPQSLRSARARRLYARACARGEPTRVHAHVNGSVSRGRAPRSTIGMYGERKTNARCPCTPQSTVGTFGEEISAEACSGKEIAGLLRKIMMMMSQYLQVNFTVGKLLNLRILRDISV